MSMLRCRCAPAAQLVDRRNAERQAAPEEVETIDTSPGAIDTSPVRQ